MLSSIRYPIQHHLQWQKLRFFLALSQLYIKWRDLPKCKNFFMFCDLRQSVTFPFCASLCRSSVMICVIHFFAPSPTTWVVWFSDASKIFLTVWAIVALFSFVILFYLAILIATSDPVNPAPMIDILVYKSLNGAEKFGYQI